MTNRFQAGDRVKPNDAAQTYYNGRDTDTLRRGMVTGIVRTATYREHQPGDWTGSIEVIDQDGKLLHFRDDCLNLDMLVIEEEP